MDAVNSQHPPKDTCHLVYWLCLVIGTGVLLAFNLLITCADYFAAKFPLYPDLMFYVVPASSFPQLIFLVVMILYGHKFSFSMRIIPAFLLTAIFVGIVPFFVQELRQSQSFWIVLAISALIGFTTAILQSSVIGFCNFLPSSYIQISIGGQAMSGITACVIRIVTKLFDIYGGLTVEEGGLVYFVTAAGFSVVCAISFMYASSTRFAQHYLSKKDDEEHIEQPLIFSPATSESFISTESSVASLLPSEQDSNNLSLVGAASEEPSKQKVAKYPKPKALNKSKHRPVSYSHVFRKIWKIALALFLVFYITLLPFPGLIVGIQSQYNSIENNAWMPVILTTEYNVGDWCGRQLLVSWLRRIKWTEDALWKACLLRIVLYPIFIVLFLGYWKFDILAYAMTALLALSNGYFCCICFMIVPSRVKSHEQQVCASIMSFMLVSGITLGSYTSLAVSPFI